MAISEALTVTPVELTVRDDLGISTLSNLILHTKLIIIKLMHHELLGHVSIFFTLTKSSQQIQ